MNCVNTNHANATTFVDVLRGQAADQPQWRCFTYLRDGEADELHLTTSALDRRARAIAAHLQERGLAGGRAFLFHPPGTDFIAALFGCFYAGVTAVPAYPPRRKRQLWTSRGAVVCVEEDPFVEGPASVVRALVG